ncbi:hypothetical protein EMIT043CA1_140007 [Pseudomonas brassicacearum]
MPAMKFMRFPLEPRRLYREQALLPQINPLATKFAVTRLYGDTPNGQRSTRPETAAHFRQRGPAPGFRQRSTRAQPVHVGHQHLHEPA